MTNFAVKRLVAVEIEPTASHQHEFNAGTLRRGLGFPEGRSHGALSILAYLEANEDPQELEGTFTLYDARADHPTRSEYRMYYSLPGLMEVAKPDDMLVLYRDGESAGLRGVLARPGTGMERRLEQILRVGDYASLRSLVVRTPDPNYQADAGEWVQTLFPAGETTVATAARGHPLFAKAVATKAIPATKRMAEAGREIAVTVWGAGLNPDDFLVRGLEAESELFFAVEKEVGTGALHGLRNEGQVNFEELLAWALRIQQSRKSRRGQSLQNHFGYLMDREGIPYTAQCLTERGETPDFVIPGHAAYHDPGFPSERLRMVGCKSTVRERWSQILREADRIAEKYLLTVDDNLSADVIRNIHHAQIRIFLPASAIRERYKADAASGLIASVGELLALLKLVL